MDIKNIKFRCMICQKDMAVVCVPFRGADDACDTGCFEGPHAHVGCETCSPGAFCSAMIDAQNNELVYAA